MSFILPYTLKRFLAQFLMPTPVVIEIFVLGWALRRFTRFKRTGTAIKILAGCLFLAFGYGWGSGYLYRTERQYPPFDPPPEQCERLRGCDVVVLGQGMPLESDLPIRYRAGSSFQARLWEGVRMHRLIPESRMLVSMAGEASNGDKQAYLDEYAAIVDIPKERFVMMAAARDTTEEAQLVRAIIGTNDLILVTSAAHMPRAMLIFNKKGMTPVPAPCDYQCLRNGRRWRWTAMPLPAYHGFANSGNAVYEWLGIIYERVSD